ncbi:glycosyltransferase family 2 protein [Robertmurraya kyonggiensis]|uniref:Glycosyltransferase family 2 protein n=1 Tax=Robertmurraya kyonggiensis TaxID=1037680 RepID=A0A4U1D708_9BACI|nr:glycosyltransferase family 2 protein [Robertmurraya kyonggiensis]TKC16977.1 glycosyltransferase family 2 protein [Robertmurraya kyonggiensis]
MKLSIVIPCYNEAENIRDFHEEIEKIIKDLKIETELIFVNDGSKDQTLLMLKELSNENSSVSYVSFSRNFGKEAAMLAGLEYATGDAIVIMDADLQHPPHLIPSLVEKYDDGYDQVVAKRTRRGETKSRTLVSKLYYKLMNHFIEVDLVDGVGDFRLLSRKALNALLSLKEYNRFSKGLFSWIGFKEYVIEYENVVREAGQSKWTFSKLLNYGIDGILSFNNKPLRISIYIGMGITILSTIYILVMLFQTIFYGINVPGYFTTISAVLVLGGIQLVFLGVIGEYIGRIYYEAKNRPIYIVDEENIHQRNEISKKY